MLASESNNAVELIRNIDGRRIEHVGEVAVGCEACKKFDAVCLGNVAHLPCHIKHEHIGPRL